MTQNFFVIEKQKGVKGQFIPVQNVVDDISSILSGQVDDIPAEKFLYIGTISEILKSNGTANTTTAPSQNPKP